ncbi:hypothetical protein BX070DRAFT_230912 [Coemansia spiralis]|nr:hypothetical protein BX070DRAFT_230912 [Coemansia spiralis]
MSNKARNSTTDTEETGSSDTNDKTALLTAATKKNGDDVDTCDWAPLFRSEPSRRDDTPSSESGNSASTFSSEFFGDHYIKETDDSRINKKTGVGACSLHPCLTRRANTIDASTFMPSERAPGRKLPLKDHKPIAQADEPMPGTGTQLATYDDTSPAAANRASYKDGDEKKLVDLLTNHRFMHDKPPHRSDNAVVSGIGLPADENKDREKAHDIGKSTDESSAHLPNNLSKVHQQSPLYMSKLSKHSYSTSQLPQPVVQPLTHQVRQDTQTQHKHPQQLNSSSSSSLSSPKWGFSNSAYSDNGVSGSVSTSHLSQRRKELTMAGMRHTEATAYAVRSLERGLVESIRSGADTPTVDLVQTAVSVREVSKLIGRTVVQMNNVRRIMIVTKPNDTSLVSLTRDLAIWLMDGPKEEGSQPIIVYIEEHIARHRNFNLQRVHQKNPISQTNLLYWTPELCAMSPEIFDFVVTLGGDGTVLYTSWLFQKTVPPIIPFHLGSLGFLTVFDHKHARRVLGSAINNGVRINLRMRFTCTVYRLADAVDPENANLLVDAADCNKVINHAIATHGIQGIDDNLCQEKEESSDMPGSAKLAAINNMSAASSSKKPARSFSSSFKRPPPPTQLPSLGRANSASVAGSGNGRAHSRKQSSGNHSRSSRYVTSSSNNNSDSSDDRSCGCSSGDEFGSAAEKDGGKDSSRASKRASSANSPPHTLRKNRSYSSNPKASGHHQQQQHCSHKRHGSQHKHHRHHDQQQVPQYQCRMYSGQTSSTANNSSEAKQRRPSIEEHKDKPRSTSGSIKSRDSSEQVATPPMDNVQETLGEATDETDLAGQPLTRHSTINESEWDDVPKLYQRRMRKVWKRDSTFQVMNEVVVDRGPSPYLSQLELYGDGNHLTTVEADGLCLATPTGSTAYSLAAGGSLVHPEIPAILVTPICPHTLSFRPMLLPDSMVLRVVLPPDSRNTAWASFDGRHRIELRRGDHIQITASKYPLPTVCASQSQTQDWMASLSRCLHWNERKRQKKFPGGAVDGTAAFDSEYNAQSKSDDDDGDDEGKAHDGSLAADEYDAHGFSSDSMSD